MKNTSNNGFVLSVSISMVNVMVGLRLLCDYRISANCRNHKVKSQMYRRRIGATVKVSVEPCPALIFQSSP